jgi:hypothetical protein
MSPQCRNIKEFLCVLICCVTKCVCWKIHWLWTNIVEPDRPQMAVWRMRIARWLPKATHTHTHTHTHTLRICNTFCFSTTIVVSQKHHSVTLYVSCLVFFFVRMISKWELACCLYEICRYIRWQNSKSLNAKVVGTYSYTFFIRANVLHNNDICDLEPVCLIHCCSGNHLR